MICKVCGKEVEDDAKFCNYCGAELHKAEQPAPSEAVEVVETSKVEEVKPKKVWVVFSKISKILGIVTLCTSVIPYLNLVLIWELAVVGIVMGALGKKANTPETLKDASLGLKLSIAATVISLVLGIICYILFVVLLGIGGALGSMMQ